jgi:hypothetical protein
MELDRDDQESVMRLAERYKPHFLGVAKEMYNTGKEQGLSLDVCSTSIATEAMLLAAAAFQGTSDEFLSFAHAAREAADAHYSRTIN